VIALHGVWNSAQFHIWGEDSALLASRTQQRLGRKRPSCPHPCSLSARQLSRALVGLVGGLPLGEDSQLSLRLPSGNWGPSPSPELLDHTGRPGGKPQELKLWSVPSLAFGPAQALELLLALPAEPPAGLAVGASLRYWAEAAKLILELLAHERFLPDVAKGAEGSLVAQWRPVVDGDVPERVRLLAVAMPPLCRAMEDAPPPSSLLNGFIAAAMDGWIRKALGVSSVDLPRKKRAEPLAYAWLRALLAEKSVIAVPSGKGASLLSDVGQWTGQSFPTKDQFASPQVGAAFRTCFRLEPPPEPADGAPAEYPSTPDRSQSSQPAKPGKWVLSFHLQAQDDRSLLIDAGTVWREHSGMLTFLRRRFENPQERLLADLGRASRLFPPLELGLKAARPVACELPTEDAYVFLKEGAPLLEQSGYGVLVPPWWRSRSASLGVRAKVRSAAKAEGPGLLGLDSLVQFDWELALGDEILSRRELERLASLKVPLVQVRGQWVELRPHEIEAALRFFQQKQEGTLGEALRMALGGESPIGLPVSGVQGDGWLGSILGDLSSGVRLEELPSPDQFRGSLRPYQAKGLSWLAFLDRFGLGACLADDMGLGKTIQLIALLLHERSDGREPGPTLLVAPMSVVGNWRREVERFAPSLRTVVHHGTGRHTGKTLVREARRHDLVITTYALAHRDLATLSEVPWHRVVLDEAQNIKNPSAQQTQALRSLKVGRRVALTGTPVENRLSDMWSIMEFLNPGYLGPAEQFRRRFAIPIEKYRDSERSAQLRRLVQPFLLRRLKTDPAIIHDLPEKMEAKVFCHLTREQASLYQAVVKDMMQQIEAAQDGIKRKGLVLATLLKLKQVCNHPAQFLQDGSTLSGRSGKLLRLVEMLEEAVAEGDRALVFTQFAEMGQMLRAHLREHLGQEVLFLYGGTSRKARDEMVQHFQTGHDGPAVFVLSLKAGGLGLNLTAASRVFHFDRWWNPAVEDQATDRAFRIGQKKNVQVYKFVCAGTLEERIDQTIEHKKELAESVVGTGEDWLTEMSTDQLRQLFALSREAVMEEPV